MTIKARLNNLKSSLLDILFPKKCLGCRENGAYLCSKCISSIPIATKSQSENVYALYSYTDERIKKAIWLLKYKYNKKIGDELAFLLYSKLICKSVDEFEFPENSQIMLVPIPLSKKRMRERGFNQSEILAKEIVKNGEVLRFILKTDMLTRSKDGPHQTSIQNRAERIKNIEGSFTVTNKPNIEGKCIILIDDVTTTGATLVEGISTLKEAGARKVVGVALAH